MRPLVHVEWRACPRRAESEPGLVEQAKGSKTSGHKQGDASDLHSSRLYLNRELSNLGYFARVLAQASDDRHPLLERLRFLAMVSEQIDEFFMVRVSDLLEQLDQKLVEIPPEGMTPVQQLATIRRKVTNLFVEQRRLLCEQLLPKLDEYQIRIVDLRSLTTTQRAALRTYFEKQVFPVLTPLAVDPGHPFPHISNRSVNLAVELVGEGSETRFARVKIPDVIPRLIHVERIMGQHAGGKKSRYTFVWLDDIIAANLSSLFPGIPVLCSHLFQVIRDADIEIHEEEGVDLRRRMEKSLLQARFQETVRLNLETGMPEATRAILTDGLKIGHDGIYAVDRPLGLDSLQELTAVDRPDLKYAPVIAHVPAAIAAGDSLFASIDRHDLLVSLPYDSFATVLDLLTTSTRDDKVLAIKQTLYRVGRNSPVVHALLEAVNEGKQVAVLVELKARFDEESNIEWARELERAGVHVTYGFADLKTHAKVALVVRKDHDGIRRYVHVGTGNYNVETARSYTDIGLLTSDAEFGADATDLFNYLTGYSEQKSYRRFLVAPVNLRQGLLDRIEREIRLHKEGGSGRLIFKCNGLIDQQFIEALYRASQAGCKVDLIVRGICCLRPGVPGVSENIRVVSLVGRFLEHSRVYYFSNAGEPEMLTGSADLMPRNLDHRVEVIFPILDPDIRERVYQTMLQAQLRDTTNAWSLRSDGEYERIRPARGEAPFDSQATLLQTVESHLPMRSKSTPHGR
ncbi:MAG: polyphosphate kinase 1 [Chloroflexi bacterium]|nr:MAG: polyphosphate kinase 1 [Chloroflexota bacterium]